jgi:hypothetical protein
MDLKKLKETYGYSKGNYKYITPGAEILKYVGQNVVIVDFKKEDGTWKDNIRYGLLKKIEDFDILTMTYMCTYSFDGETEEHKIRIIPEGFSFEDPEKTGTMTRFIPMSLHFKMVEDEYFYTKKLRDLYDNSTTMPVDALQVLSDSGDQKATLRYAKNIGAAIELEDNSLVWIRIQKLKLIHKKGTKYFLSFGDENENISMIIDTDLDRDYYTNRYGKIKILDLEYEGDTINNFDSNN